MIYNNGQVLFVVLIVLGLVLGFGGGYYLNRNMASSDLQKKNIELAESLEKIKKALPKIEEVRSFEGIVRSVGSDTITIEVASSSNPFDEWPIMREVRITPETKILHRSIKSPEVLQKEFEVNKKILDVFFQEEISVSGIKQGWKIIVEAEEDIKTKESFTATRILDDWPFDLPLDLSTAFNPPALAGTAVNPLPVKLPKTFTPRATTESLPKQPSFSPPPTAPTPSSRSITLPIPVTSPPTGGPVHPL